MAVQFILGRSGTGKTSYCIKAIVNALLEEDDKQPLIFLVPEQATYQAERAILADKRVAGYHRLNVLSFDRLQFLLSGKETARPGLSRLGQQMIIQRILGEHKDELKIFGETASRPGMGRQMADAVAELHQYAKTPDDIEQLLAELQKDERKSLTAMKFADIGLVLREYIRFIEGKYIDPDIQLARSCKAAATSPFVKGAKLWVDGFAGFTTAELAVLIELLKTVSEAKLALCIDASKIDIKNPEKEALDPVSLFGPTERTYAELVGAIKKCRLKITEPMVFDRAVRFADCAALAHIEQNIFQQKPSKQKCAGNIRIMSAPNARSEVQFVARQILQLVRQKDYRYRDIAVIASDIDRYQDYIGAYFGDYGIPFFIDRRRPLNRHPAVNLICSALRAAVGGFLHSDIFSFLKTDLAPIERKEADLLENYCLAFGVTGKDWASAEKWQFAGEEDKHFDEGRINRIRLKVSEPLVGLRDKLRCGGGTIRAEEFVRIIFGFLEGLGVRETIGGWIKEATAAGDYSAADEHRQFYEKLLNVFDEFVEVFGGQQGSVEDYFAIINSAFSQMTLAFIPPMLDQVLVGSIERSRHPDLKAVFLMGAAQRDFPSPIDFESILTDDDRGACEEAEFRLAGGTEQRLTERQYLAYIAFTRPSQFLCVTYPSTDQKGSCVVRSQFITGLESLFENLREESVLDYKSDIESIHSRSELADMLCSRLGRDSRPAARESVETSRDDLNKLLNDITSDEELCGEGARVIWAINYDNRAELDKRIVDKFFGGLIKSSATRLSTYAACPYQYFARYILELKEREEFKLEPLDLGLFYHRVLEGLLKRLNRQKKNFASVEKDELLKLLREEISEIVTGNSFISNFRRHSRHNAFIIQAASEVLEDCAAAIAEMVRAGEFCPVLSEVSFGDVKGSSYKLGDYELALSGGRRLSLNGKIDRLDAAELDSSRAAIVFDYKRRAKSFSWSEFYYGLDMQLPIYILAVGNATNPQYRMIKAAGAFYMPVEISPKGAGVADVEDAAGGFGYKAKGIFNGEFFQQLDRETSSGWSKFYNFRISSKDEQYGDYGKSGALRPADFEKVLKFTDKKIIELVKEIVSGRIEVKPYRLSDKSACSFCKYKAVCRFDWQINDFNILESLDKQQVLEKIERVDD